MSTEDNKANVRRWIEEGWNQGNVAAFDELAASNWINHDPGFPTFAPSKTTNAGPPRTTTPSPTSILPLTT